MLQRFKLNWKTTIAGLTSGIPILILGIQEKDVKAICAGIGLIFGGILAADAKTKGTNPE